MKKKELIELVGYHVDDIYPRLSRRGKVVVKGFKRYLVDTNKKIFEAAAQRASKDKVRGTYYPLVPETIREIMQHVGKDVESVSRKDPKSKYHIFSLFVICDSLYCRPAIWGLFSAAVPAIQGWLACRRHPCAPGVRSDK